MRKGIAALLLIMLLVLGFLYAPAAAYAADARQTGLCGEDDCSGTNTPKSARDWNDLGNDRALAEDYVTAIENYNKALEMKPNWAWPLNNRAMANAYLGNFGQALSDLERALGNAETSRQYHQILYNRYLIYEAMGNRALAQKDKEKAAAGGIVSDPPGGRWD
jgi:tetratricopeptide (TPR) repeat protein